MLYTKKDLKFLRSQAANTNFGSSVRDFYKECVKAVEKDGKVDTADVRKDEHGNSKS